MVVRSTTEFTRGYQIWYMIKREFIGVCICAFVQLMLFMPAYSNDSFRIVSGVLFSVVQFWIIYDGAAFLGKLDQKSYTPLKYDIKWSVVWGVILALISGAFMVMFKLNWHFGNPASLFVNVLFYIWTSPYMAFTIMKQAYLPVAVVLVSIIIPIVSSVAGYTSGKYGFSISDKLSNIMFEKDKKDT